MCLRWNVNEVKVIVDNISNQVISCSISTDSLNSPITMAFSYGLHTVGDRKGLWSEFDSICTKWCGLSLIIGDLNTLFDSGHKKFGNEVSESEIVDGCECLDRNNLSFMKSQGHYFSWCKSKQGTVKILSRIDHCIGNPRWFLEFGSNSVQYMNFGVSDHCPLLLQIQDNHGGCGRPFRFFTRLVEHPRFMEVVQQVWNS